MKEDIGLIDCIGSPCSFKVAFQTIYIKVTQQQNLDIFQNESTINLMEEEQLHSKDSVILFGFNNTHSDYDDVEKYISQFPYLQFNGEIERNQSFSNEKIVYFQGLGYFHSYFMNSVLMMRQIDLNFSNGQLSLTLSKLVQFKINFVSENITNCPTQLYYKDNRFILHCLRNKQHCIVFTVQHVVISNIITIEEEYNGCNLEVGIIEDYLMVASTKCENWDLFKINLAFDNLEQTKLQSIITVVSPEFSNLNSIKFREKKAFLMSSFILLQYFPQTDAVLVIFPGAEIKLIDLTSNFGSSKLYVVIEGEQTEQLKQRQNQIIVRKDMKYKQILSFSQIIMAIYNDFLEVIHQGLFYNSYNLKIKFALPINNIPYILMIGKNNSILAYRIILAKDTVINSNEQYQNIHCLTLEKQSTTYSYTFNKITYLKQEDIRPIYYSEIDYTKISNFFPLNYPKKMKLSGFPCNPSLLQDIDSVIEDVLFSYQFCHHQCFKSNQYFYSFNFPNSDLVIIQQGKEFSENVKNCLSNSKVYFIYVESEISHQNIYYHRLSNLLIIRQLNTVSLFRITGEIMKKVAEYFFPQLETIRVIGNELYLISSRNDLKYSFQRIFLPTQEVIMNQESECRPLFHHSVYSLWQCANTLLLTSQELNFYYSFNLNIQWIDIISIKENIIIYDLMPGNILVAKLYAIKYPDIVFRYTLPLYSLQIVIPIISYVVSAHYSILACNEMKNKFILTFNIDDIKSESLVSIIRCDNEFYAFDFHSIIFIKNEHLMLQKMQRFDITFRKTKFRKLIKQSQVTLLCTSVIHNFTLVFNLTFSFQEYISNLQYDNSHQQQAISIVDQSVVVPIGKLLLGPVENIQFISNSNFTIINPVEFQNFSNTYCQMYEGNICFVNDTLFVLSSTGLQLQLEWHIPLDYSLVFLKEEQVIIASKHERILSNIEIHKYNIITKENKSYTILNTSESSRMLANEFMNDITLQIVGNLVVGEVFQESDLFVFGMTNSSTIRYLQQLRAEKFNNYNTIIRIVDSQDFYIVLQYQKFQILLFIFRIDEEGKSDCNQDVSCHQIQNLTTIIRFEYGNLQSMKTLRKTSTSYYILMFYERICYIFEIEAGEDFIQSSIVSFDFIGIIIYPYQAQFENVVEVGGNYVFIKFKNFQSTYIYDLSMSTKQAVYKIDPFYSFIAENINHIKNDLFVKLENNIDLTDSKQTILLKQFIVKPWKIACKQLKCYDQTISLMVFNSVSNITFDLVVKCDQKYSFLLQKIMLLNQALIICLMCFKRRVQSNIKYPVRQRIA